jgi:hypothetical protein
MKVFASFFVAVLSFAIYEVLGAFPLIAIACLGMFIWNRIETVRTRIQD